MYLDFELCLYEIISLSTKESIEPVVRLFSRSVHKLSDRLVTDLAIRILYLPNSSDLLIDAIRINIKGKGQMYEYEIRALGDF